MKLIVTLLLLFSFNLKSQIISYNNCDSVDRIQKFYVDFNNGSTYNWNLSNGSILFQDNNKVTVLFPDTNTNFVLSVVEFNQYGCQGDVKKIIIESKPCELIWIPSAFTPNDDNLNDTFKVVGKVDPKDFVLEIFNKWGERIFVSNNPNYGWDGKYKEQIVQDDVYVYKIICKINSKYFIKYGSVTLLK
jgi:gliding motility-associated-like protein